MRYLVTGGGGFIGSNTVDELVRRGHSVVVLDDLSSGKPYSAGVYQVLHLDRDGLTRRADKGCHIRLSQADIDERFPSKCNAVESREALEER